MNQNIFVSQVKCPTNHWTHPTYNKMTRRIEIDSVQGIDIVPT